MFENKERIYINVCIYMYKMITAREPRTGRPTHRNTACACAQGLERERARDPSGQSPPGQPPSLVGKIDFQKQLEN